MKRVELEFDTGRSYTGRRSNVANETGRNWGNCSLQPRCNVVVCFCFEPPLCLNSAKRPAAGHGLKTIKRPAARYFPYFPSKSKYLYEMFYFYLQSSSASMQPKISNLILSANPVYRVQSYPSA